MESGFLFLKDRVAAGTEAVPLGLGSVRDKTRATERQR